MTLAILRRREILPFARQKDTTWQISIDTLILFENIPLSLKSRTIREFNSSMGKTFSIIIVRQVSYRAWGFCARQVRNTVRQVSTRWECPMAREKLFKVKTKLEKLPWRSLHGVLMVIGKSSLSAISVLWTNLVTLSKSLELCFQPRDARHFRWITNFDKTLPNNTLDTLFSFFFIESSCYSLSYLIDFEI